MKILTVVGARPNFMKAAPIIAAVRKHNEAIQSTNGSHRKTRKPIQHVLVHTGQHYDQAMSDSFFADLNMPAPDVHLGVGSGSHAQQTAEVMKRFEPTLLETKPDVVIVVGDVNSTLACALVTAKIAMDLRTSRPLVAHVEAGLRSFDRTMPEELNRILTDQLSDFLFVTEESAMQNLKREGIPKSKIHFVGNTMIDSLLTYKDRADKATVLDQHGLRTRAESNGARSLVRPYALLTLHRPANVDDRESFGSILEGLSDLSKKMPVIFPTHPRTRKRIEEFQFGHYFQSGTLPGSHGIWIIDSLGYVDFMSLMKNARIVLTDSGGIQEETTCLAIPCVTLRENTERPATLKYGTNMIAGTTTGGIRKAIARRMSKKHSGRIPARWDGKAAQRIVKVLTDTVDKNEKAAVEKDDRKSLHRAVVESVR